MFLILPGWQPRWFVLDNGILSYYDSQDDVCKGSKGSIKMAVCEIKGKSWISARRNFRCWGGGRDQPMYSLHHRFFLPLFVYI